jgi:hypothetical protein
MDLTDADARILGDEYGFVGRSVSGGEIDGDGYGDIVLAAPAIDSNNGEVYVFFGSDF